MQYTLRSIILSFLYFLTLQSLLTWCFLHASSNAWAQTSPPNIVFIMADDLGFDDLGSYGGDISTPHLDALAAQGMRFTRYQTAGAVCSPTRASILTGEFPLKFGITRAFAPDDVRGIPSKFPLLSEKLKGAGYVTGHVGKWHLGNSLPEFRPHGRGFDSAWEWSADGDNNYYDFLLSENGAPFETVSNTYFPRFVTDKAKEFIQANKDKRFFLNVWHFTPHQPVHIPPGFDNTSYGYPLGTQRGKLQAMVTDLDSMVKEILDELDAAGVAQNTLVIFTSDNGAQSAVVDRDSSLRGSKEKMFQGGIQVPLIIRWPGVVSPGTVNNSVIISNDHFATLLQIAGAKKPSGNPAQSYLEALTGNQSLNRSGFLYWEIDGARTPQNSLTGIAPNFAVREGKFKYVFEDNQKFLFDLDADPSEQNNLISQYPKKASKLIKQHAAWRLSVSRTAESFSYTKSKVKKFGKQFTFFKDTGYLSLANQYVSRVGGGDVSIAFSLRQSLTSGKRTILENNGFLLRTVNRRLLFTVRDTEGNTYTLSGPKLSANKWYRIAISTYGWRVGQLTMRLAINGKLHSERTEPRAIVATSDAPLIFGNGYGAKIAKKSFRGVMRDIRIHNLSFIDSEIKKDFLSTKP